MPGRRKSPAAQIKHIFQGDEGQHQQAASIPSHGIRSGIVHICSCLMCNRNFMDQRRFLLSLSLT